MIGADLARRLERASRKGREYSSKAQELIDRRDRLILEAIDAGATQAEVAKGAGISQPSISGIVNRERSRD